MILGVDVGGTAVNAGVALAFNRLTQETGMIDGVKIKADKDVNLVPECMRIWKKRRPGDHGGQTTSEDATPRRRRRRRNRGRGGNASDGAQASTDQ